jgi:hypothetical protein
MLLGALTPDTLCHTSAAGSYLAPPLIDFPHKIISEPLQTAATPSALSCVGHPTFVIGVHVSVVGSYRDPVEGYEKVPVFPPQTSMWVPVQTLGPSDPVGIYGIGPTCPEGGQVVDGCWSTLDAETTRTVDTSSSWDAPFHDDSQVDGFPLEAPRQPIHDGRPRETLFDEEDVVAERRVDLLQPFRQTRVASDPLELAPQHLRRDRGVPECVQRDRLLEIGVTFFSSTVRGTASSNGFVVPI